MRRVGDGASSSIERTCLCPPGPTPSQGWGMQRRRPRRAAHPSAGAELQSLIVGLSPHFQPSSGSFIGIALARESVMGDGCMGASTANKRQVCPGLALPAHHPCTLGGPRHPKPIRETPCPSTAGPSAWRWAPPCLIGLPCKGKAAGERLFAELNSLLSTAAQWHHCLPAKLIPGMPEHRDCRRGEGLRSVKEGD